MLQNTPAATAPFTLSRTFGATQAQLFAAFTEPELMKHWWAPKGVDIVKATMDLRPGGSYHYCMRPPQGPDMWGKFAFLEVEAPRRLVFLNSFSDADGGLSRHPMAPTWPAQMHSVFLFEPAADGAQFTMEWSPHEGSVEETATFNAGRDGMKAGWTGTLNQLDAWLASAK